MSKIATDEKTATERTVLCQAIYASEASESLTPEQLMAILTPSRAKNEKKGISGILVYHKGSFLQVLEGPVDAVEPLIDIIKKDTRHRNFKLLFKGEIEEKEFESWSMSFVDRTGENDNVEGYQTYNQLFQSALNDQGMARRALHRFQDGAWRTRVNKG